MSLKILSSHVKMRPLKFAFLVDSDSPEQVREAIRLGSTLWGGTYSPIIELHEKIPDNWSNGLSELPSAETVIRGCIDAFDPDFFIRFSASVPPYLSEYGIETKTPEDVWPVDKDNDFSPGLGIGLFEILNEIFEKEFKYISRYLVKIIFPELSRRFPLFLASCLGEIPSALNTTLKNHYYGPLQITTPVFNVENIVNKSASGNVLFPIDITRYHTRISRRHGYHSDQDACVFFMDAEDTGDIVDYWNLRATGKQVWPLPKQLKENPEWRCRTADFLKKPKGQPSYSLAPIMKARSCAENEIKEYADTLKELSEDCSFSFRDMDQSIWNWFLPDDIYEKEEGSVDIAGASSVRFRFVVPKFASKYSFHNNLRCANEIGFRFLGKGDESIAEVFPKSSGDNFIGVISGSHVGLGSLRYWRVGRNGLVRLVVGDFSQTREIFSSEKIFFAWLKDLGWEPELSPPGLLAKDIRKKLGGIVSFLRDERLLGLLEYMNGGSVKKDGSFSDKSGLGQERHLPVGEVKKRLELEMGVNPHDYLVRKGIFRLGPAVQCPHCSRYSWYALESVGDLLTCPKCLDTFDATGNLDRCKWSYKTAGPFSISNYAEGAYAVLLALDFFSLSNFIRMGITSVTSFKAKDSGGKNLEVDFAAFWQDSTIGAQKSEGLLLGECKTYGEFKDADFEKMRGLAEIFPEAMLVFSTLRENLKLPEIEKIKSIIDNLDERRGTWEQPTKPVMILTAQELLSSFKPSHCKGGSLLSLCRATQQIYLKTELNC